MPKRRPLVAGNWKMNGRLTSGLVLVRDLIQKAESLSQPMPYDMVICPPAGLLWPIHESLMGTHIHLGGQDCHFATHGPYTGDISAAQLADMGCRYVIVGHSERRQAYHETSQLVAQKAAAAQLAGLIAIICIGETAEQRAAGATLDIITRQVTESVPQNSRSGLLVIAYEPIWAIGTGQQPTVHEISEVHRAIRKALGPVGETVQILYGGSVTPGNAGSILSDDEVDGVLAGNASLNADGFWAIGAALRTDA